jgi:hypothetical protein
VKVKTAKSMQDCYTSDRPLCEEVAEGFSVTTDICIDAEMQKKIEQVLGGVSSSAGPAGSLADALLNLLKGDKNMSIKTLEELNAYPLTDLLAMNAKTAMQDMTGEAADPYNYVASKADPAKKMPVLPEDDN